MHDRKDRPPRWFGLVIVGGSLIAGVILATIAVLLFT